MSLTVEQILIYNVDIISDKSKRNLIFKIVLLILFRLFKIVENNLRGPHSVLIEDGILTTS